MIKPLDRQDERAWEELFALAPLLDSEVPEAWCLIGAQMVRVHAAIAGAPPPRVSRDVDLLGDSRAQPGATKAIATLLGLRRFLPVGPSRLGTVHRFIRGEASETLTIDILGPDNLGPRARLTTYGTATTLAAPRATFALKTAAATPLQLLRLDGSSDECSIRLPSLTGALGIKACAVGISTSPNSQLDDLILLLSIAEDPTAMREAPNGPKLAKMLRTVAEQISERARTDDRSLDALGALAVLTDP